MQFLLEEQSQLFKLSGEAKANNIYCEVTDDSINSNEITNLDIEYLKKDTDSYKKITRITNKFGGVMEIETTDEKEETLTRGGYRHVRTLKNEANCKEYGDRNFSAKYTGPLFSSTVRFHYTLHYGRIEARKISKEEFSILPGVVKYNEYERKISKSTSTHISDRITGYIEYRPAVLGPIAGGLNVGTIKIEMNVIQAADANHPSIAKMNITQNAEVYEKVFS